MIKKPKILKKAVRICDVYKLKLEILNNFFIDIQSHFESDFGYADFEAEHYGEDYRFEQNKKYYKEYYNEELKNTKDEAKAEKLAKLWAKIEKLQFPFEKMYFFDFLYQSTIALTWSHLEDLLNNLVKLLEQEHGRMPSPKKRMPKINYLLMKINNYGLRVDLDPELREKVDEMREIRNSFVHSLGADLPNELRKKTQKEVDRVKKEGDIDEKRCEKSLDTASEFLQRIKEAFEKKFSGAKSK